MMAYYIKIVLILLLLASEAGAQIYNYEGKNEFARQLTDLLNQSVQDFKRIKGQRNTRVQEAGYSVFNVRYRISNCKEAFVYLPDNALLHRPYAEYTFFKVSGASQAEAAYLKATQLLQQAYRKKWLIYRDALGTQGLQNGTQTLFCYQLTKGFLFYSCRIIARQYEDSTWKIIMRLEGGEPAFFRYIPRNSPVISDLFVHGFRKNLSSTLEGYLLCHQNMPGYNCRLRKDSSGQERMEYYKSIKTLLEADFEFDNAVSNSKVGMGSTYVYTENYYTGKLRNARFVHIEDINRSQYAPVETRIISLQKAGYEVVICYSPPVTNQHF